METKNSEALFQWRSEVVTNGAIIVGGQEQCNEPVIRSLLLPS